ncbi:MAG: 4-hydroxy-tetrahydrodipicolinate synthase [Flavobacteriales bacterium]|nr:4-hydroxy-tetrahydrodipicolinate synthase [Flavobacteriales bacterium]
MRNGSAFEGLGVAMVTPFNAQGQIDYPALQRLVEHLIQGGVDYLVVHGTTGESPVLGPEEKRAALDFVLEVNNGRRPVVLGIGGNNTAAVVKELKESDLSGVTGILSVSPSYNKPTQVGIVAHYRQVAEASSLPFILYNVPARTSSNVEASTTLLLADEIPHMVAVKEASGNMVQIMEIIQDAPEGFAVLSGDDALGLPILAAGGKGVISVVGNAFPDPYAKMVHAARKGDMVTARHHHYQLLDTINLLFVEGNPSGVKEALQYLGICERHVRLPLVSVSEETRKAIYASMAEGELVG